MPLCCNLCLQRTTMKLDLKQWFFFQIQGCSIVTKSEATDKWNRWYSVQLKSTLENNIRQKGHWICVYTARQSLNTIGSYGSSKAENCIIYEATKKKMKCKTQHKALGGIQTYCLIITHSRPVMVQPRFKLILNTMRLDLVAAGHWISNMSGYTYFSHRVMIK